MRTAGSILASVLLLASTRLTWAGLAAVAMFCVLVWDAQRRVRGVLRALDVVNDRLDTQADIIEEIRSIAAGPDEAADGG